MLLCNGVTAAVPPNPQPSSARPHSARWRSEAGPGHLRRWAAASICNSGHRGTTTDNLASAARTTPGQAPVCSPSAGGWLGLVWHSCNVHNTVTDVKGESEVFSARPLEPSQGMQQLVKSRCFITA